MPINFPNKPGLVIYLTAGDPDLAEFFDYTTRTEIPYNAALNTPNTQPFTIESWIYPVSDQASTGMGVWFVVLFMVATS